MKYSDIISKFPGGKFYKKKSVNNSTPGIKLLLPIFATLSICSSIISGGISGSWTSPALPYLQSNISQFNITEFDASWIGAASDFGSIIGHIVTPILSNVVGRKSWIIIASVPKILSWILIIFAKNVATLHVARIIHGISFSFVYIFSLMYVSEIADKNTRGRLILMLKISMQFGSLIVKVFGAYFSYKMMNISIVLIQIPFFFTFLFMPESPHYLMLQNRKEDSLKSLMKFRGTKNAEFLHSEFTSVQNSVLESQEKKKLAIKELFCVKRNRKSFSIMIAAAFTKFLSGANAIDAYTQDIFNKIGTSFPPEKSAMIFAMITLVMSLLATQIIDRFERRKTFLISGIFSAIGLGIFGCYMFVKLYLVADIAFISWLPFVALIIYNIAINLGIANIVLVLAGEVFPLHIKATGITCCTTINDFLIFFTKFVFIWTNAEAGIYTTFWMYAICCISGSFILFSITPETKGKSLEEIQNILHSNTKNMDN